MDRQKIIVIVILAVIVVLYIVFVVYGSVNQEKQGGKKERTAAGEDYEPPKMMKNFGSIMSNWFGRFLPRPKIENCPQASAPKPKSEKLCEDISSAELRISESDSSFRALKVVSKTPNNPSKIVYTDFKDEAVNPKEDRLFPEGQKADSLPKPKEKPDQTAEELSQESIIVLKKGGILKISCKNNNDNKCRVDVE